MPECMGWKQDFLSHSFSVSGTWMRLSLFRDGLRFSRKTAAKVSLGEQSLQSLIGQGGLCFRLPWEVVGRTQVLPTCWMKGPEWLLAKRPPSVLCRISLLREQLTNVNLLHQSKWEAPEREHELEGSLRRLEPHLCMTAHRCCCSLEQISSFLFFRTKALVPAPAYTQRKGSPKDMNPRNYITGSQIRKLLASGSAVFTRSGGRAF